LEADRLPGGKGGGKKEGKGVPLHGKKPRKGEQVKKRKENCLRGCKRGRAGSRAKVLRSSRGRRKGSEEGGENGGYMISERQGNLLRSGKPEKARGQTRAETYNGRSGMGKEDHKM